MKTKAKKTAVKIVMMAFFMALCYVLPLLTGQIQQMGNALLPMHLPVLLCGFLVGPAEGALVGLVAPVSRSLIWTMPPMASAIPMSAELAVYGLLTGLLFNVLSKRKLNRVVTVYISLIVSMLAGRLAGGAVTFAMMTSKNASYSLELFFSSYFAVSAVGIVLQLILIPALAVPLGKVPFIRELRKK